MIPLPSRSPFTGGEIIVTRFYCPESDSSVEGQFAVANPFAQLSQEQLEFVELFVRSEGRISRMEGELELSYPTIRSRLKEIIGALGYDSSGDDSSGDGDAIDSVEAKVDSSSGRSHPSRRRRAKAVIRTGVDESLVERQRIIQALDAGEISFEDAMRQLDGLD